MLIRFRPIRLPENQEQETVFPINHRLAPNNVLLIELSATYEPPRFSYPPAESIILKIVYYSPHPLLNLGAPSGYATHMREIMGVWREMGHEVIPLIMGGLELNFSDDNINDYNTRWKQKIKPLVPSFLWETARDVQLLRFDRYAAQELRNIIKAHQPDLIYERAAYLQTSGVKVAQEKGVPHMLEVNSPYVEERQAMSGASWLLQAGERAEQTQLQLTERVVVVSTALQNYFQEKWGTPAAKFVLTPNAIDPAKISPDPNQVARLRQTLDLESKIVFGFVGSIFPWHGVDLLIEAFAQLDVPNAHLLIVGDGEIRNKLEDLAQELALDGRITFTGSISHSEVFSYLDLMDVTLMPKSNWYGSPIKIFEYGAMGKVVIAPNNSPVKDVMVPDRDGLLVEPHSESLLRAMKFCINQPQQSRNMAVSFQKKVLSQHTWSAMGQKILHHAKAY